jgi:cytochrome c-type biogenesis protein CcmE
LKPVSRTLNSGEKGKMKISGKLIALSILVIVSVALIFSAVQQSDPYLTVTQVVEHADRYQGRAIQVIGVISGGAIDENSTNTFQLTDNQTSLNVVYRGPLPENFKIGVQAVIVGTLSSGKTLEASNILLKCPSKYSDQSTQAASGPDYTFYAGIGAVAIVGICVLRPIRKPL